MDTGNPRRVAVSSRKVGELVFDKIFPAMQGEPQDAMILSLFAAAAITMKPQISNEELHKVIMDISGYLILQLQEATAASDGN